MGRTAAVGGISVCGGATGAGKETDWISFWNLTSSGFWGFLTRSHSVEVPGPRH